jgi:AraC family transcriptional regulator
VLRDTPFEVIHFNFPRATLDAFGEDAELPYVGRLHCTGGQPDPVLYHLAEMIRPYIARKIELPGLFLDHNLQMRCGREAVAIHGFGPYQREDGDGTYLSG